MTESSPSAPSSCRPSSLLAIPSYFGEISAALARELSEPGSVLASVVPEPPSAVSFPRRQNALSRTSLRISRPESVFHSHSRTMSMRRFRPPNVVPRHRSHRRHSASVVCCRNCRFSCERGRLVAIIRASFLTRRHPSQTGAFPSPGHRLAGAASGNFVCDLASRRCLRERLSEVGPQWLGSKESAGFLITGG